MSLRTSLAGSKDQSLTYVVLVVLEAGVGDEGVHAPHHAPRLGCSSIVLAQQDLPHRCRPCEAERLAANVMNLPLVLTLMCVSLSLCYSP